MNRVITLSSVAALLLIVMGCGQPAKPVAAPASTSSGTPAKPAAGDHPAHGAGPHGGTLTDWGGGAYHVEFTVDHGKKEAIVYVLGSDEKSPSPIKAKVIHITVNDPMTELDLAAKPLEGEAEGTSSRFVGIHDTFGIVKEFAGTLSGEVENTPYTGDFKEEPAK